jgi:2-dehydro-3-deoxygalactonokinase
VSKPTVAIADWGTSSFRIWLLDAGGDVLAERRSGEGMSTAGGAAGFAPILEKHLADMQAPTDLPVVICGMAGARQGWVEAPYVTVPAGLGDLASGAVSVPGKARKISILPGLAQRSEDAPDVMRGEETQLAGVHALFSEGQHLICMPGTHCKWVEARDGRITGFRTWMTGELFSVLSKQSILRHSLGERPAAAQPDNEAFSRACVQALDDGGDIGASLFRLRAASLLQDQAQDVAAARLSGLLIGAEIASALRVFGRPEDEVILVGSGALGALYARALGLAGLMIQPADADEAVRAGLTEAARRLGWIMEKRA